MKSIIFFVLSIGLLSFSAMSCNKENFPQSSEPDLPNVVPVDISVKGFELLEKMQGHWIGRNKVLSWDWDWFAFDYRPISPSHVFGIYEGGTMGNLLTSFFVTDFKGTRTIMARNGGVLNGIYRTSYFVLEEVRSENGSDYYRLVDALGGKNTMYMELVFKGDELDWNAYTSRLGEKDKPTNHMSFKGKKIYTELAEQAAEKLNFPQNIPAWDFSKGFPEDYLYQIPERGAAKSASFLDQTEGNDVFKMAITSGDPFKIQDHPHLSYLQVDVERSPAIQKDKLFIYLSFKPLTDGSGFFLPEGYESILLFPEISASKDSFLFTYLHPGEYYLTVIADHNKDGLPGEGDITHPSRKITITPESEHQVSIANIKTQN